MAFWKCPSCKSLFCDECIGKSNSNSERIQTICQICGGICDPLGAEQAVHLEKRSFFALLPGAFLFPLNPGGIILIIMGSFFFCLLKIPRLFAYEGILVLFAVAGYITALLFKILNFAALGKKEFPEWPLPTDFVDDIASPAFSVYVATFVCFVPAFVFMVLGLKDPQYSYIALLLAIAGGLYYPMALIATALNTHIFLNPFEMIRSIMKTALPYLFACILFGIICASLAVFAVSLLLQPARPLIMTILSSVIFFYLLVVEMHILGLIYYMHEHKLNWFE